MLAKTIGVRKQRRIRLVAFITATVVTVVIASIVAGVVIPSVIIGSILVAARL